MLDEEPGRFGGGAATESPGSDEDVGAGHPFAVEVHLEIAPVVAGAGRVFVVRGGRGAFGGVGAGVPEHDGATAVFAFGDRPFEGVVADGMIFDLHGQPFDLGVGGGAFGNGPAFHDAIQFESKIEVELCGVVFLNDESQFAHATM